MLAMIFSSPPQRAQLSISTPNTRFSRLAQLIATCRGVDDDPEAAQAIREATSGGVDCAFEMAGAVKAMELAYRITRRGGTTVTAGLAAPGAQFCVPQVGIVAEERTIKGSYLGSCVPQRDIPRCIEWYQAGKLPVNRSLAGSMSLDGINSGLDALAAGETLRQTVLF